MSVSVGPGGCLRHWCSSTSLRISPLHVEFHLPLPHSSQVVSSAIPKLSSGLSHSTWLDHGCPHCPKFPTAACRSSLGRVSVPVWLVVLSNQLRIVALVGHYLTN